ncbi:DUF3472 domain-containing protein [Nocardia sp. NPDC051570]|uniref:DUF3472 domain-containing protein n=1 Tax=Nocardia sp. NPDC051570 TaxID=3364324 RepID=UPI0037B4E30C
MHLIRCARAVLVAIAAALFTLTTATDATAAQAGVWQWWNYPTGDLWNLDTTVTVRATGPTRFFSHQIGFEGNDGGYLGIQDTPNGRIAIFAVWNSPGGATPGPNARCETFGGEGVGWHCLVPFDWSRNVGYRLRIWRVDGRADGSTRWVASVADTRNEQETVIGTLWTRAGQRGLRPGSTVWIEDYGGRDCANEVAASATFSYPTGNDRAVTATRAQADTATCGSHRSSITDNGNATVTLTE